MMNAIYKFFRNNHILAVCENAVCQKAFTLNLSRFEMSDLPELVSKCENLLKLFLNHNHLQQLPTFANKLIHLQVLTLDYNKLTEFPSVICQLTTLKILNVSCNEITTVPKEIGQLVCLETFWCNNTGLAQLPTEIGNCESLETLGVRGNKLQQLPDSIRRLKKLRWLTLESNELTSVPHGLKELKELVHLNLKNNRLLRIPSHTLAKMSKLQYVFLNDNRIEQICSTQQLQSLKFIRMLNLCGNPFCELAAVRGQLKEHENILYELIEQKAAAVTGDLDDFEVDDEEELSDWENSIETSDLDSTDDSSLENDLEDISILIPELSRYITNFS